MDVDGVSEWVHGDVDGDVDGGVDGMWMKCGWMVMWMGYGWWK
jgi:hypothetical protein